MTGECRQTFYKHPRLKCFFGSVSSTTQARLISGGGDGKSHLVGLEALKHAHRTKKMIVSAFEFRLNAPQTRQLSLGKVELQEEQNKLMSPASDIAVSEAKKASEGGRE